MGFVEKFDVGQEVKSKLLTDDFVGEIKTLKAYDDGTVKYEVRSGGESRWYLEGQLEEGESDE